MRVLAVQPIKFVCILPKKRAAHERKKGKKKGEQGRRRFVWISEERTAKNKGGAENGGGIEGEEKEKDELSRREEVLARKETNERTNKQTNKWKKKN